MKLVFPSSSIRSLLLASAAVVLASAAVQEVSRAQNSGVDATDSGSRPVTPSDLATVDLMDAARAGKVTVAAEGRGDGVLLLTVANRSRKPLRIVLPSALTATGAAGRYGVLGGLGGGVSTLGRPFANNADGAGQPAGLAMFGRLVTTAVEPHVRNLAGFTPTGAAMLSASSALRSVAPAGPASAELAPGQSRRLATRLVSLEGPPANPQGGLVYPALGQDLTLAPIESLNFDGRTRQILERLGSEQAASGPAQLVLWRVAARLDWSEIEQAAKAWANPFEVTLARRAELEIADPAARIAAPTRIYVDVDTRGGDDRKHVDAVVNALAGRRLFGMRVERGAPARPVGPAVALRMTIAPATAGGKPEARVTVYATDSHATAWTTIGKFSLPILNDAGSFEAAAFADAASQAVLSRLVRAQLSKGPREKGKLTYRVRIDNGSPLILNGLAVAGLEIRAANDAQVMAGISLPPHRNLILPVSVEYVEKLGLKRGVRVLAADFGGL